MAHNTEDVKKIKKGHWRSLTGSETHWNVKRLYHDIYEKWKYLLIREYVIIIPKES